VKRLAILLSGRGSNFRAIHEAIGRGEIDAAIAAVISNRPDAPGLAWGEAAGLKTAAISHRDFASREEHERAVIAAIEAAGADLVVLAGYMRLLSPLFVDAFRNRIVNIHPSLLPSFPGVNAQGQALAHGVKVAGCTVHFVDETLDNGPIVVQRTVEVQDDDTEESLSARILEQEHLAYPEAIRRLCSEPYVVEGRRVRFIR
jgi:phosphoribosylglycinamide formyltransferase 1